MSGPTGKPPETSLQPDTGQDQASESEQETQSTTLDSPNAAIVREHVMMDVEDASTELQNVTTDLEHVTTDLEHVTMDSEHSNSDFVLLDSGQVTQKESNEESMSSFVVLDSEPKDEASHVVTSEIQQEKISEDRKKNKNIEGVNGQDKNENIDGKNIEIENKVLIMSNVQILPISTHDQEESNKTIGANQTIIKTESNIHHKNNDIEENQTDSLSQSNSKESINSVSITNATNPIQHSSEKEITVGEELKEDYDPKAYSPDDKQKNNSENLNDSPRASTEQQHTVTSHKQENEVQSYASVVTRSQTAPISDDKPETSGGISTLVSGLVSSVTGTVKNLVGVQKDTNDNTNTAAPPGTYLRLSSDGPAQRDHSKVMGVYAKIDKKTSWGYDYYPVYKKVDGPQSIYVDKSGFWSVSRDGSGRSDVMFHGKPTTPKPPVTQWKYLAKNGQTYLEDKTIRLEATGGVKKGEEKVNFETTLPDDFVSENRFRTILELKNPEEIVIRFHILVSPEFHYVEDKMVAVLQGLEHLRPSEFKGNPWLSPITHMSPKKGGSMISTKTSDEASHDRREGYVRMVGIIKVPKSLVLGKSHEYKYMIGQNSKGEYETLSDSQWYISNRLLHIPKAFTGEYFDQYDDVVQRSPRDRRKKRQIATEWFMPSLPQLVARKQIYRLFENVDHVCQVFYCHEKGIFFLPSDKKYALTLPLSSLQSTCLSIPKDSVVYAGIAKKLTDKLFVELQNVHENKLQQTRDDQINSSLYLSLFYFLLLKKVPDKVPLPTDVQYGCLVTAISPYIDNGKCLKQKAVSNLVDSKDQIQVAQALEEGINIIMKDRGNKLKEQLPHWLKMVPMIHYLRGVKDTISLAYEGKDKQDKFWGLYGLEVDQFKKVHSSVNEYKCSLSSMFPEIRSLTNVSPVLPYTFLRSLPYDEFLKVITDEEKSAFFPTRLLIAATSTWFKSKGATYLSNSQAMADEIIPNLMTTVLLKLEHIKNEEEDSMSKIKQVFEIEKAFMMLYDRFLNYVPTEHNNFRLIEFCLQMALGIFHLIDSIKTHITKDPKLEATGKALMKPKMDKARKSVVEKALFWIEDCHRVRTGTLEKRLTLWSEMCNILEPLGDDILRLIYAKVISALEGQHYTQDVLDAFTNLEASLFPFIHERLEEEALKIMEKQVNPSFMSNWVSLPGSSKRRKEKMAKLYSVGLRSSWKRNNSSVGKMDDANMMKFTLTSEFLTSILKQEELAPGLIEEFFPPETTKLISKLMHLFAKQLTGLINGHMTIGMFQHIMDCSSSGMLWERYGQANALQGFNIVLPLVKNEKELSTIINCRHQEIEEYTQYQKETVSFLQIFNGKVGNLTDFIEEFPNKGDLDNFPFINVCAPRRIPSEPIIIPRVDDDNRQTVSSFHKHHTSAIFRSIVESFTNEMTRQEEGDVVEVNFLIDIIVEEVVTPSIKKFRSIVSDLMVSQIPLKKVERLFGEFNKDVGGILVELETIENILGGKKWSKEVWEKVCLYFQMSECKKIADVILKVKKVLNITTEFPEIQKIIKVYDQDENFFDAPLSSLSDEDIKFGKIFEKWKPEHLEALQTLDKSQNLVRWLKESMNSNQEFKFFVDLASISAGEEDIEVDRVKCMQASVTAYSAFIFDLKNNSVLTDFLQACDHLNEAIKLDPKIPTKLKDTDTHLPWIKVIKERHGSVETSSLQQVEAINHTGVYKIGYWGQKPDEAECLKLTFQEIGGHKKDDQKYLKKLIEADLEELRSKLMLISKSDENKIAVDIFVQNFLIVQRLKTAGIQLHEAGCNLFTNMVLTIFCDPKKKVKLEIDFGGQTGLLGGFLPLHSELPVLADFLEKCLQEWKDHLGFLRTKYSSLNFFRTDQLVNLAGSLSGFLGGQELSMSSKMILSLLMDNVDLDIIKAAFEKLPASFVDVDNTDDLEDIEVIEMTGDGLIEALIKDYCVEEDIAKAAVMANIGENSLEELFQWTLDNQLDSDTIENFSILFDNEKASEEDNRTVAQFSQEEKPTFSEFTKVIVERANSNEANLQKKLSEIWKYFLMSVETVESSDFLNLQHVGEGLQNLHNQTANKIHRKYPGYLISGRPNLVICPTEDILSKTMSLYMIDEQKVLPKMDEILICTNGTTKEEVELICRRAFTDTLGKIYCVLYADSLDYATSIHIENLFMNMERENCDYRMVFFCSKSGAQHSTLATALDKYVVQIPQINQSSQLSKYIEKHLARNINDRDAPTRMRIISSTRAGLGKSLQAKRIAETLESTCETTQLHEKNVDYEKLLSRFSEAKESHTMNANWTSQVYHIDITQAVDKAQIRNDLLFQLTILNGFQDKRGRVWTCDKNDLYLFEMTRGSNTKTSEFDALLPTTHCLSPQASLDKLNNLGLESVEQAEANFVNNDDNDMFQLLDHKKFLSPVFQRPIQYLERYQRDENLDDFFFLEAYQEGSHRSCLETLLAHCPVEDPSYGELTNFASFLNIQLSSCESSIFCNLGEEWSNLKFKNFVTKFMILMAKDFATRSFNVSDESEGNLRPRILDRRKWESSSHPYIFFNEDGVTMSFFGFHHDKDLNLINPQTNQIIERNIMTGNLYQQLKRQQDPELPMFNYEFDNLQDNTKLKAVSRVLGVERDDITDPDPSYKLTSDNVRKILAIHTRFQCKIPVIIMGETGSGKTRLIKYLCDLSKGDADVENMHILKVHGGITASIIHKKVQDAIELAELNNALGIGLTVLFFDEANTTSAIGTIKEVMVDRLNDGRPIPKDSTLQFVAAVNPYREHSTDMIKKLENAGLGYHIKAEKTKDMLGSIPLRRLVYRVQALPLSLFPLVWDFGTLNPDNEEKYIIQMVRNVGTELNISAHNQKTLVLALCRSQDLMRKENDECSFVSLRDVERTLTVFNWLFSIKHILLNRLEERLDEHFIDLDEFMKTCLLSLGISYYVRLEKSRSKYSSAIQQTIARQSVLVLDDNYDYLKTIVHTCQDIFIDELLLDTTIAKNDALKENFWMMVICTELKIPLFLVGKPGSSKSLAKTLVGDAMQGPNSKSDLFKTFKELHMVSFQCSPIATSDAIVGTFRQCQKWQEEKYLDKFASVVILDEVGLAEDSPKMPLKALHPLLEDGCVDDEKPAPHKKVSFVGISNWALDPAKMNRGILLSRAPPDMEDLVKIGKGIGDKTTASLTDHLIPDLANGYLAVYKEQKREYFGLRDYYSLIKMISACAKETKNVPTYSSIQFCVKRNFGGFFGNFYPAEVFMRSLKSVTRSERYTNIPERHLIKESLSLQPSFVKQEGRYVLLLTRNNAALKILQMPGEFGNEKRTILFGSSFPKDQEYTQICSNINRIKMCMETGVQVVLCNLDNLYESLYDALNQNYVFLGGNRYVDLGLGTHRVKCRVHPDFRLILVAEDKDVYEKFPIPLINRLEKHYLGMETIMSNDYAIIVEKMRHWVNEFCLVDIPLYKQKQYQQYDPADVFVGYHEDVIPGLILQILQGGKNISDEEIMDACKQLLLQCATPDSIMRLTNTRLKEEAENLFRIYFLQQTHDSLPHYIKTLESSSPSRSLIQVTTHSRLLTASSKADLAQSLEIPLSSITLLSLQQFRTEDEFRKKAGSFFQKIETNKDNTKNILIAQIEAGTSTSGNLVECAKYVIQELVNETKKDSQFQVVLIVQLPRVAGGCYAGYPGEPWRSVHIDELRQPEKRHPMHIQLMKNRSIYDIVKNEVENKDGILSVEDLIESITPKAASMLKGGHPGRQMERIDKFLNAFKSNKPFGIITMQKLVDLLKKKEESIESPKEWLSKMSVYNESLKEGMTFRSAVWQACCNHVVLPLAYIMATIDSNANLDILEECVDWKNELFLRVYSCLNIASSFDARSLEQSNEVIIQYHGFNEFKTCLPFCWKLVSFVDTCLPRIGSPNQTYNVLNSSEIGKYLKQAWKSQGEQMAKNYLEDFLKLKMHASSKEEYNTLSSFIMSLIKERSMSDEFSALSIEEEEFEVIQDIEENKTEIECKKESHEENLPRIGEEGNNDAVFELYSPVEIHQAYDSVKDRLNWYSAIVQSYPGILRDVETRLQNGENRIDLVALQACLVNMSPQFDVFGEDIVREAWILEVKKIQPLVEQMMKMNKTADGEEIMKTVREDWTQIQVIQMFLHHVTPPGTETHLKKAVLGKIKMLWLSLRNADFRSIKTFNNAVLMLKKMNLEAAKIHFAAGESNCVRCVEIPKLPVVLPCGHVGCQDCLLELYGSEKLGERRCPGRKCKNSQIPTDFVIQTTCDAEEAVKKQEKFRVSLNLFFMDLLSTFCFGFTDYPPEQKILEELLKFITVKDFGKIDPTKRTKELSPFEEHGIDSSPVVRSFLLQLCLKHDKKYSEDHIQTFFSHKRAYMTSDSDIIEFCQLYMNCIEDTILHKVFNHTAKSTTIAILQASNILTEHQMFHKHSGLTIENLDSAAHLRFALKQVAAVVAKYVANPQSVDRDRSSTELLMSAAQFASIEGNDRALHFLVRELCFMHRNDAINELRKLPEYKVLLPIELRDDTNEEDLRPDLFLLSGNTYKDMRDILAKALHSSNFQEMSTFLENNQQLSSNQISLSLVLSIRHHSTLAIDKIAKDGALLKFLKKHNKIWYRTPKIQKILDQMFSKKLSCLELSEEETQRKYDIVQLAFLVKTIMATVENADGLQKLLYKMVRKPSETVKMFLPTMIHDVNFEVVSTLKKEIDTGHAVPPTFYTCPKGHIYSIGNCGKASGHQNCLDCGAKIGGQAYDRVFSDNKALGNTTDKTQPGYLLGQAGGEVDGVRDLTSLETTILRLLMHCSLLAACVDKKDDVKKMCKPPMDVEQFLIQHIDHGIVTASKHLGRNQDEVFILIHSMFSQLIQLDAVELNISLDSHASRIAWENAFVKQVIKPNIAMLPDVSERFKKLMKDDKEKVTGRLDRILYSQVEDDINTIPHSQQLWQVRHCVRANTLLQWIISSDQQTSAPHLVKFLQQLDVTTQLGNLPQILQLHKFLTEKFHRRVALSDLETITVAEFLEHKLNDDDCQVTTGLVDIFLSTWNALQSKLQTYGGQLAIELSNLSHRVFESALTVHNTPASVLFPSSHGTGICSFALVRFLIDHHNQLVRSDLPPIPPSTASDVHVAALDTSQVQILLLAHTRYSLQPSGVTQEEYDVKAMERHIFERYVRGRPRLLDTQANLPHVQFLEDRGSEENQGLQTLMAQKTLGNNIQHQIEIDFRSLPDLCELLNSVLTAREFLITTGGQPEASLQKYLETLHLWSGDPNGAIRHLQLCHVDALKDFLYLTRAQRMIKNGQNPFEQVICLDYREKLPPSLQDSGRECLKSVSCTWLVPCLFKMIWSQLRSRNEENSPNWGLGTWLGARLMAEGEEAGKADLIPDDILVKHAVSFFYLLVQAKEGVVHREMKILTVENDIKNQTNLMLSDQHKINSNENFNDLPSTSTHIYKVDGILNNQQYTTAAKFDFIASAPKFVNSKSSEREITMVSSQSNKTISSMFSLGISTSANTGISQHRRVNYKKSRESKLYKAACNESLNAVKASSISSSTLKVSQISTAGKPDGFNISSPKDVGASGIFQFGNDSAITTVALSGIFKFGEAATIEKVTLGHTAGVKTSNMDTYTKPVKLINHENAEKVITIVSSPSTKTMSSMFSHGSITSTNIKGSKQRRVSHKKFKDQNIKSNIPEHSVKPSVLNVASNILKVGEPKLCGTITNDLFKVPSTASKSSDIFKANDSSGAYEFSNDSVRTTVALSGIFKFGEPATIAKVTSAHTEGIKASNMHLHTKPKELLNQKNDKETTTINSRPSTKTISSMFSHGSIASTNIASSKQSKLGHKKVKGRRLYKVPMDDSVKPPGVTSIMLKAEQPVIVSTSTMLKDSQKNSWPDNSSTNNLSSCGVFKFGTYGRFDSTSGTSLSGKISGSVNQPGKVLVDEIPTVSSSIKALYTNTYCASTSTNVASWKQSRFQHKKVKGNRLYKAPLDDSVKPPGATSTILKVGQPVVVSSTSTMLKVAQTKPAKNHSLPDNSSINNLSSCGVFNFGAHGQFDSTSGTSLPGKMSRSVIQQGKVLVDEIPAVSSSIKTLYTTTCCASTSSNLLQTCTGFINTIPSSSITVITELPASSPDGFCQLGKASNESTTSTPLSHSFFQSGSTSVTTTVHSVFPASRFSSLLKTSDASAIPIIIASASNGLLKTGNSLTSTPASCGFSQTERAPLLTKLPAPAFDGLFKFGKDNYITTSAVSTHSGHFQTPKDLSTTTFSPQASGGLFFQTHKSGVNIKPLSSAPDDLFKMSTVLTKPTDSIQTSNSLSKCMTVPAPAACKLFKFGQDIATTTYSASTSADFMQADNAVFSNPVQNPLTNMETSCGNSPSVAIPSNSDSLVKSNKKFLTGARHNSSKKIIKCRRSAMTNRRDKMKEPQKEEDVGKCPSSTEVSKTKI